MNDYIEGASKSDECSVLCRTVATWCITYVIMRRC